MDRVLVDLLACPLTGGRLEPWSAHGNSDDMSYGVLRSDAADYPVVEGIPVMVPGFDEVVALVRAGRHDEALVRMHCQKPKCRYARTSRSLAKRSRGSRSHCVSSLSM